MIIYVLISKSNSTTPIAEYSEFEGDFPEMCRELLTLCPKDSTIKIYTRGEYSFYVSTHMPFTYLLMCSAKSNEEKMMTFIRELIDHKSDGGRKITQNKISERQPNYNRKTRSEMLEEGENKGLTLSMTRKIKELWDKYQNKEKIGQKKENDQVTEINIELDEITCFMKKNIHTILERGDKLSNVMGKTETLVGTSEKFYSRTKKYRQRNRGLITKCKTLIFIFCCFMLMGYIAYGLYSSPLLVSKAFSVFKTTFSIKKQQKNGYLYKNQLNIAFINMLIECYVTQNQYFMPSCNIPSGKAVQFLFFLNSMI